MSLQTNNPVSGALYLLRGFSYLLKPGIRAFVLVPLLINVFLFAGALYLLFSNFSAWVQYLTDLWLPDWEWLSFLEYLLWPLLAVVVVIGVYYGFSIVANLIAAPFNGILAERVEQELRGQVNSNLDSWQAVVKMVPRALGRELAKLAYYLPRLLLLFILSFIPVLNLLMPFVWFAFAAWMMAIQYCDYPMDNNGVSFKQMKKLLSERRWSALGFGSLVQLGMLVPGVNLILMPTAVIGATLFWVEQYRR